MGIEKLLQELKPITKYAKLHEFRGQTCGVDASCWLHRASFNCALRLVTGESTTKYLQFTLNCIKLLKYFNITPIIVFDGAHLPMKANENHKRNVIRDKAKKLALAALKSGDRDLAYKEATKAVHITKPMITGFMNQCIAHNIQFVCAPYEADSQLGYMYKQKQIDFVLTEDSDLVLFGVRKALYKFDPKTMSGQFLDLDLIKDYKTPTDAKKRKKDLCSFLKKYWVTRDTDDAAKRNKKEKEFVHACVLSGCDYVDRLPGIGLKTAIKHCTENRKMEYLLSTLMMSKPQAPKDYHIQFKRAVLTFRHQTVYDIESKAQTHLNPLTDSVDLYLKELKRYLARLPQRSQGMTRESKNPNIYDTTLDFLGKQSDDETARAIAEGEINARSLKPRRLQHETPGMSTENESNHNTGNRFVKRETQGISTENESNQGNRFVKRKSTENTSINVFQQICKAKAENTPKTVSNRGKISKYFGVKHKEEKEPNALDLDGLLASFSMYEYNCQNADDIKEQQHVEDVDYNEHKPLQRPRKNRKRKRSMMENDHELECDDGIPLQNIKNNTNSAPRPHKVSRRRLNPIQTPRNVHKVQPSGWMSDLWNASSSKRNKCKSRMNCGENKENIGEKRNHNPFSVKRKNIESLAMIGAEQKPMESSESESEEEELKIRKRSMSVHEDIYDCLDAEEEERMTGGMYSQLSQSQSEKQVYDMVNGFHTSQESKMNEDEDDDIEIIKKHEVKEVKKCVKAKPFKKPKFMNGGPPVIRKVKTDGNGKNKKKAKKKKKGTQQSIMNFFTKK